MFATRNNIKDYMRISRANTARDNEIDGAIPVAEADVVRWCKRRIEYEAGRIKTFNGSGNCRLVLDLFPIVDGAEFSLWISSAKPRTFDDETLVDPNAYEVDPESGIVHLLSGRTFPKQPQSVKASWTGGYWPTDQIGEEKPDGETIEDMPGDIREAVEIIVADRLTRSAQLKSGQPQASILAEGISGQQQATYQSELCKRSGFPVRAVAKLAAYRFTF